MLEQKIEEYVDGYVKAQMSKLEEEKMDDYQHTFSKKFLKKMKQILWGEKYFGQNVRVGSLVRKIAMVAIVMTGLLVINQVSAKMFDFNPLRYIYSAIVNQKTQKEEKTSPNTPTVKERKTDEITENTTARQREDLAEKDTIPTKKSKVKIKIDNQKEQYKEVAKQLTDIKDIKVKYIDSDRVEEIKDIIYCYYFKNKNDLEHLKKDNSAQQPSILYSKEDVSEFLAWSCETASVQYNSKLFGDEYIYKKTDDKVIEKATRELLERIGLQYGKEQNGYIIDKKVMQEDKSIKVYLKRCIEDKEMSLTTPEHNVAQTVEDLTVEFGDDQIIALFFEGMTDIVEVVDKKQDILVKTPEEAYRLLCDYMAKNSYGKEYQKIDLMRVAYVEENNNSGAISLCPMVEFEIKGKNYGEMFQVNILSEEVRKLPWAYKLIYSEDLE